MKHKKVYKCVHDDDYDDNHHSTILNDDGDDDDDNDLFLTSYDLDSWSLRIFSEKSR